MKDTKKPTLKDLRSNFQQVSEPAIRKKQWDITPAGAALSGSVLAPRPRNAMKASSPPAGRTNRPKEPPIPPPRSAKTVRGFDRTLPSIPALSLSGSIGRNNSIGFQRSANTAAARLPSVRPSVAELFPNGRSASSSSDSGGDGSVSLSSPSQQTGSPEGSREKEGGDNDKASQNATESEAQEGTPSAAFTPARGVGHQRSTIGGRGGPVIGHMPRGLRPLGRSDPLGPSATRGPSPSDVLDFGWKIYDPLKEYQRIGLDGSEGDSSGKWRISCANTNYEICPTYPAYVCTLLSSKIGVLIVILLRYIVIPGSISDSALAVVAKYRSKGNN